MFVEHKIDFSVIVGKVINTIDRADRVISFNCSDGTKYSMWHAQDCCEDVYVESITGDLENIVEVPILDAYCSTSTENQLEVSEKIKTDQKWNESFTWSFYTIRTLKGTVTIRWYGSSNGYYSESVEFVEIH